MAHCKESQCKGRQTEYGCTHVKDNKADDSCSNETRKSRWSIEKIRKDLSVGQVIF